MHIQGLQPTRTDDSSSYLNIVADAEGHLTLKVLGVNGRMAKSLTTNVSCGNQKLPINLDDLNEGVYVLNAFNDGDFIKSIRFIKQ
jgi:hypothetical protein